MKITKDQGHVKWFLKCHETWNNWKGNLYEGHPSRTNVCIYIRTSVVYPLIMGTSTLITAALGYWALLGYPSSTYGLVSYFMVIGSIIGLCYLFKVIVTSKFAGKFAKKQFERIGDCVDIKISWFRMLCRWAVDKHDKICTLVEIVDND